MAVEFPFPFELFIIGPFLIGGAVLLAKVAPTVLRSLRQAAYDRATVGERRRWALRLDAAAAGDPDAARRLVGGLHPGTRRGVSRWAGGWPQLVLALRWTDGRARWEIEAPRQLTRAVETAVAAAFPGAELEAMAPSVDAADGVRLGVRGQSPAAGGYPAADFGAVLVELLARLPPGATAAWLLRVWPQPDRGRAGPDDAPGFGEIVLDSLLSRPPRKVSAASLATRPPSAAGPAFSTHVNLEARGAAPAALRAWLFDAIAVVSSLRAAGWTIEARVGARSAPMRVGPADLAELWGLSGAASEARAVDVVRSRRLRPALVAPAPGLRPIGLDTDRPILVPESLFARHVMLLGRTGSGKSTELVALAADDLRAGRGFTFIDPHGDAVARLLDAVPPDQAHRVHLLELAEKDRPRAFNPIELNGSDAELVAAQFVDTMRDLYFANLAAPAHRQMQYLRSALMTLLSKPAGAEGPWTLESLNRLFVDPRFREELTVGLTDPILSAFWKHQWPHRARGGADPSADALISKLAAFLSYPSIRAIVSAPASTIRPRRIMDAGDVLLVDLSRAGGDNAWLFGGLVIARYYVDALGRQSIPPAARVPHTLYIDEVHNFDTSALRGIPAEGRKFALQLVMATQYLDSLGRELQRAIRANVATLMLLQPSADDAHALRGEMAPLTERDLVNLPRFRMAVRTELGGETTVLTADVLPAPPALGSTQAVRRLSDERDGRGADPR
jgi:hypothetical protein